MRKLTQTGFHRIPHNPNQRIAQEGGVKPAGEVLDAFNDKAEDRVLHPTKGWRKLNTKRTAAALTVAQVMFREQQPKRGPKPNRYMPHIGAKQRAKGARP